MDIIPQDAVIKEFEIVRKLYILEAQTNQSAPDEFLDDYTISGLTYRLIDCSLDFVHAAAPMITTSDPLCILNQQYKWSNASENDYSLFVKQGETHACRFDIEASA